MKNLYLTLLLVGITASSTLAQDFVYALGQHRFDTVVNENYESFEIEMVTPTPEGITFKCELLSNGLPVAWSYNLCYHAHCLLSIPPSWTMNHITASEMSSGTSGFLQLNLTTGLNYGDGDLSVYVYDESDYSRGDTVTWNIHWPAPATSVDENQLSISAYPNPVTNELTVANQSSMTGTVVITDVLGKVVYTDRISALASKRIDFSELVKGMYMVSLNSDSGTSVTQKIIKK